MAQEGSGWFLKAPWRHFLAHCVTALASLGSKIESTVARNAAKRNAFERILFSRGLHIVLTNKKEKLSLGAAGQNRATEKQKKKQTLEGEREEEKEERKKM